VLTQVAYAQRQPRTIKHDTARAKLVFSDLIEGHAAKYLGGLEPLAAMRGADAIGPSVYVTLSSGRLMVWDEEIGTLNTAGAPMKADLANCPPACIPKLRDAVANAVASEVARLRNLGDKSAPRVILLADTRLPYTTFLAVAYSIANSTAVSPPDVRLAVRAGEGGKKIGTVPLLLAPPHGLKLSENANPILLHIAVEPHRFVASARKTWLPWPEQSPNVAAIVRLIGELKARDTNKTAVFVTASPGVTLGRVLELVGPVRALYPNVVLGDMPQITGPAE
jgi:hypothetical protein